MQVMNQTYYIEGMVCASTTLDCCILQFYKRVPFDTVAKMYPYDTPPNRIFLYHFPNGGNLSICEGKLNQSFNYMLQWEAIVTSNAVSSGGGYFDTQGRLCGVHVAVAQLGYGFIRSVVPIFRIRYEFAVVFSNLDRDHCCMKGVVPLVVQPCLYLDPTRTILPELKIPVVMGNDIRNRLSYSLPALRLQYFCSLVGVLRKIDFTALFVSDRGQTVLSVGPNGLKLGIAPKDGGVRLDMQGSFNRDGVAFYNYQMQVNDYLDDISKNFKGGTTFAHVELDKSLIRYIFPGSGMDNQLRKRIQYALAESYWLGKTYIISEPIRVEKTKRKVFAK